MSNKNFIPMQYIRCGKTLRTKFNSSGEAQSAEICNCFKKCELCGYEGIYKEFNGRLLCYQCWLGEVENPEHQI